MSAAEEDRMSEPDQTIDPGALRHGLGLIPTSVVIVTTRTDEGLFGATVGSFASVSLDPPLAAFFLGTSSDTLSAVRESGAFVINVLGEAHRELCMSFASSSGDKFTGVDFADDEAGQPCLAGVIAHLRCDVESISAAGDHDMVMGRLRGLDVLDAEAAPLVFWKGALSSPTAL